MKTNFKILQLAIAMMLLSGTAIAQEILTGIQREPGSKPQRSATQAITLPFFDDFAHSVVYPDQTKWTDNNALVNDGFPFQAPNRNAVTLDVLDAHGRVYEYAISNAFIAEYLTSARIRLDSIFEPTPRALTPADSLYFSFCYQPQGNGNPPEAQDSLVLEFGITTEHQEFQYIEYNNFSMAEIFEHMQVDTLFPGDTVWAFGGCNPNMYYIITDTLTHITAGSIAIPCDSVFITVADTTWHHIWSTPGQTLEAFMAENNNKSFKQVMIPINDLQYFKDCFYFRFYNYASIVNSSLPSNRGNEDNWNIDMVYLNINRTVADPSYPMLTFSGQRPSFVNRYQAIPYSQYRINPTSFIKEQLELDVANLDKEQHVAHYYYSVQQIGGSKYYERHLDTVHIKPYLQTGYLNCSGSGESPACPYVGQLFALDPMIDSASYLIKHYIYDSTCNPPMVDSMVYRQGFYNYFAYDDGIPEMGYGVEPANGQFAMRFEMAQPEKICGVQLLFNRTLHDANLKYFDIVIWKDQNGKPGEEIYRFANQRPIWDEGLPYRFAYYEFDKAPMLSGTFYIGLVQQSSGLINIGFDASIDNSQYCFYNVNGAWMPSQMKGTLMIRPVVGKSYYIGLEEAETEQMSLYPNPVSNTLHISGLTDNQTSQISIYDLTGKRVYQSSFADEISVADFTDGMYFISVTTAEGQVFTQKFIISK